MEYVFSGVTSVRHLSTRDSRLRYFRLGLMMLAWLFLIELVLRIPPLQARLDYYAGQPLWYSTYVPQRIDLIRQNPNADIWFIGSSFVIWGANPALIDPIVSQQTAIAHRSLDVGLFGLVDLHDLEDYLTTVFLPAGQPKVMVLGICPYTFAYSTQDRFGIRDEFIITHNHSREFDRQLSWWLYQRFAAFRLFYSINNILKETPIEQASSDLTGFIGDNSVMKTRRVITPVGDTNDRLEMNLALLKRLQQSLQKRGIQLYLINFPVYTPVIEQYPGGSNNFQAYINRLAEFSKTQSMPFLDLQGIILNANDNQLLETYFKDYYHLNKTGAATVAPYIGNFIARNIGTVAK